MNSPGCAMSRDRPVLAHSPACLPRGQALGALLRESLPPERLRALTAAGRVARSLGVPVYLIGGSVRDLLLGRDSPDLDLCVVGDGMAFARSLARALGARLAEQGRFLTAKLETADGAIDVATARREAYARPGALPQVTPGGIEDDLARRDFTVNAMAVRLGRGPRGVLDPFGGRNDLARRQLRVLHGRSLEDDPTRLLRAARYAARLGFHLERRTARLARAAARAGCLDTVSGDRIRRELLMLLQEPRAQAGLRLCERLGVLAALHPALTAGPDVRGAVRRAQRIGDWFSRGCAGGSLDRGLVRLLALAEALSPREGEELAERLRLAARARRAVDAYLRGRRSARRRLAAPRLRNSAVARALDGLPPETVAALAATSAARVRRRCKLFLARLREVRPSISGHDLAALGFEPDAAWARALATARDARLDGRARSKQDELRIAAAVLRAAHRRSS